MSIEGLVSGWYRFKQIRYVCGHGLGEVNANRVDTKNIDLILKLNNYSLYLTVVSNVSLASVAAFRATEHLILHGIFAGTLFHTFVFNMILQTWISYKMTPNVNTLRTARFRLFLTILFITFLIICATSIFVAAIQIIVSRAPLFRMLTADRLKWDETYPGYYAHGISGVFEILAILVACPFYASFLSEVNRTQVTDGKLTFKFANHRSNETI